MGVTDISNQRRHSNGMDGNPSTFSMAKMQASLAELQMTHSKLKAAMNEKIPIVLTPRARRQPAPQPEPATGTVVGPVRSWKPANTLQQPRHPAGSVAEKSLATTGFSSRDLPLPAAKPGQKYYDPSIAYSDDLEAEAAPKEKPVPKNVISGGLTHFAVAADLAFVDFESNGELEVPNPEFKAIPWNMEINPDVGGYGPYEPDSHDLLAYLSRLEEQQRVIIQLMAQRENTTANLATSSAANSHAASAAPRRRSSAGGQGLPPLAPRTLANLPAALAFLPVVHTAARERVASNSGEEIPRPPPAPPPALRPRYIEPPPKETMVVMPRWRKPVTAADIATSIQFERTEREHVPRQPTHFHWPGFTTFLLWIGAFAFYLYCRIERTLDRHSNVFAYQIVVLVAEILVGLVTARQGFTLMRRLTPKDPVEQASQQAREVEALKKAGKIRPPRKTISSKRVLADAAATAEPAESPVSDRPVLGRGSPALHPNTERVIEPSPHATEPLARPAAPAAQTLTESRSAISLVAMDEPSFSGAVKSPRSYRVSFREFNVAEAPAALRGADAQAAAPGSKQLTEGDAVITIAQPGEERVPPAQLKGILKPQGVQADAVHLSAVALAAVVPATPALKRQYHVQVLLFGSTSNLERTGAALRAAHAAEMPEHCTRSIYLVDTHWDAARSDFVAGLGLDTITYAPGIQVGKRAPDDWGRAASLNRVLRRLYPDENYGEGETVANTELVAVLDASQIIDPHFFTKIIPATEPRGIRLVHTRPAYSDLTVGADIFDMTLHHQFCLTVAGNESLGCVLATDSGFVVRADALRAVKWLPTYSEATGFALGKEFLQHDFQSFYIDEVLAVGIPPSTLHTAYALCKAHSRGSYQCLFRRHQNNGLPPISASFKFLYNTLALQHLVGALMLPLWIGIPVVQILFAVFPWDVNGWFGIGFVAYYVFATPLLFEVFRPSGVLGFWNSFTASYALGWSRVSAALGALLHGRVFTQDEVASRRERTPAAMLPVEPGRRWWGWAKAQKDFRAPADNGWGDAEPATPVAPTTPVAPASAAEPVVSGTAREGSDVEVASSADAKRIVGAPPLDAPLGGRCAAVPWTALIIWVVSGVAAGMGAWLLFGTGAPRHVDVGVLAANLPLVLSILWALANHVTAGMAVCYALGVRRQALATVSVVALCICCAAVALIAVAAIGLGSDLGQEYHIGGPAARHGFIWQQGAQISGTPSQ